MKVKFSKLLFLCSSLALCGCTGTGKPSNVSSNSITNTSSTSNDGSVNSQGTSSNGGESSVNTNNNSSTNSGSNSSDSVSSDSSNSATSSVEIDNTKVFDESNVLLTFPVISDEHAGFSDATIDNTERLTDTFETLKQLGKVDFDLVLSAGDQTQGGLDEQVKALMGKYKASFDIDKTPFFFSHGNHDTNWSGCMDTYTFYNSYGSEVYKYDLDQTAAKLGNRHMKVKGVHFIAIQTWRYGPGTNDYSDSTKTWVEKTLKEAYNDDPNKPIFVVTHCPEHSTIPGSFSEDDSGDWGASKELKDMLKNYHNVVLFSGHTHFGIHDDRAIHQDDITEVQAACTSDLDLDTKLEGVSELSNRREYSFGEIVEVDKNYNIRINRYDLNKKEMVMKPWDVIHPCEDLSHLNTYSDAARAKDNDTPYIPEGAKFTVVHTSDGKFSINFNAFQDDKSVIFKYKVAIFPMAQEDITDEKEDSVIEIEWLDDWYNYPQPKSGKISKSLSGTYSSKTTWSLKIYAYNCIGNSASMFQTSIVNL